MKLGTKAEAQCSGHATSVLAKIDRVVSESEPLGGCPQAGRRLALNNLFLPVTNFVSRQNFDAKLCHTRHMPTLTQDTSLSSTKHLKRNTIKPMSQKTQDTPYPPIIIVTILPPIIN
jgi:hypothetical protein